MMGSFDGNPFAYLTQTIDIIRTRVNIHIRLLSPQYQSLFLTIIDVLFEIHHVLGCEQIPTVCALDNTRWRGGRASRGVTIDNKRRSRRGRRLLETYQYLNHLQKRKENEPVRENVFDLGFCR